MKKSILKLFKIGKFYNAYGDDGYVLHGIFGYKYIEYKNSVGFPESAIAKVKSKLEEEKIGYQIYDKDDLIQEFKGINKNYNIILKKAIVNLEVEQRVNHLRDRVNNFSNEELEKVLEVLENGNFK